jgi:hypothetical protein
MSLLWERADNAVPGCYTCGERPTWVRWLPHHPPEPKPGEGLVMQCTGTLVDMYCDQHAKELKDKESN